MLASIPASILNQNRTDSGIPHRFRLNSSRFSTLILFKILEYSAEFWTEETALAECETR
jgi:hypothetical protein